MKNVVSKRSISIYTSRFLRALPIVLVVITCLFAGGGLTGAAAEPAAVNPAWYTGTIWHQLEAGLGGTVLDIVRSGDDIYVAGDFTNADDIADADYLARWDGSQWHAVAPGINGAVRAIAIKGTDLYIGGHFSDIAGDTNKRSIAWWDGASWNALGSGLNGDVYDLLIKGSDLYVGGAFTTVGGDLASNYFAMWNGSWNNLSAQMDGSVQTLTTAADKIFVGGNFNTAGGDTDANRVVMYDIDSLPHYTAMDTGLGSTVYDLTLCGTTVHAGGGSSFYVSSFSGGKWNNLPALNGTVTAVECYNGELYAGGYFTDAGGDTNADYLAHYTGSAWEAVGAGFDGAVMALLVEQSSIFAGGGFYHNNGNERPLNRIAQWSPSRWTPLDIDLDSYVYAIATIGEDIYIGGDFRDVGGAGGDYLAYWDASSDTWYPVGSSAINGIVRSIQPYLDGIVIGGLFTDIGGNASLKKIAYWDGVNWNALGQGLGDTDDLGVFDIQVDGSTIHAAGQFDTDGSEALTLNGFTSWTGTGWTSYGEDFVEVYEVILYEGDPVIGGAFTSLGGSSNNKGISRWDGDSWEPFASGLNGSVRAMTIVPDGLYAGGYFTGSISYLARWDGAAWNMVGSGVSNTVDALASIGNDVYAGGQFNNTAGIYPAAAIARWDGNAWYAVEGPFDSAQQSECLTPYGPDLLAGGSFVNGGGVAEMDYFAWYNGITASFLPLIIK